MTNTLSLMVKACGLSYREAAEFLDVRHDTVKAWAMGRNPTPAGVFSELASLAERIDIAASEAIWAFDSQPVGDVISLGLASTDREAKGIGWPCVGAHRAVLTLIVSRGMAVGHLFEIVPLGS